MKYIPARLRRQVIKRADNRCELGRATIAALKMNRSFVVAIREEEIWFGRHPG